MSEPPSFPPPEQDRPEMVVFIMFWVFYGVLFGLGLGWLIWA